MWGCEQTSWWVGWCGSGLRGLEASPLVVQDGGLFFPLGPGHRHGVWSVDALPQSGVERLFKLVYQPNISEARWQSLQLKLLDELIH